MHKETSPPSTPPENIPTSNTQRVFQQLRQKIIRGEIAPGERLKVDHLKSQFDTAASAIREALSLLTSDQLVERLDQRGFRVAPASEANFQEILTLRCQLDDMALRNSIALGDIGWEEQLVLIHHRLARAKQDDLDAWETLHKAFHRALLEACGSPLLLKFSDQLYDLNIRYRFLAGMALDYGKRNVEGEHQDILNAVLDRDAELASSRLKNHYEQTGAFLASQFKNLAAS